MGKYAKLFSTVGAVHNSKSGPFDLLLCVGEFFAPRQSKADDDLVEDGTPLDVQGYTGAADAESLKYLRGEKPIPVPTFFIDGGSGFELVENMPNGGHITHNVSDTYFLILFLHLNKQTCDQCLLTRVFS